MWLLSSARAELCHFTDHTVVEGGYAILSHTWGHSEQTFEDLVRLREESHKTGNNPRDCVSDKIRNSCILAEEDGYQWIWIDSCCIDKTSSSELSEAINSMFTWYSSSEACYAYLEDVPSDCVLHARDSAFRKARWHTRGWTLQELIAPTLLVFVSNDWTRIGTKDRLSRILEQITGIWRRILTLEEPYSSQSVATRMCWSSKRQTTRVEDRAYSLMGLFNVNMPTIYGEGRQAFRRLQLEIMKQSFDTSIFAWNNGLPLFTTSDRYAPMAYKEVKGTSTGVMSLLAHTPGSFAVDIQYTPTSSRPLQPYLPWQGKETTEAVSGRVGAYSYRTCSNRRQKLGEDRQQLGETHGPFGELDLPRFTQSSYGIECRFPIFEMDGVTVAVLLCDNHRSHIGLLLHPACDPIQDPMRRMYRVGYGFTSEKGTRFARIITLGADYHSLRFRGKPVTARWRDICIQSHDPALKAGSNLTLLNGRLKGLGVQIYPEPPFRIPRWLLARLSALYLWPYCAQARPEPVEAESGRTATAMIVSCCDAEWHEAVYIRLGMCTTPPATHGSGMSVSWHWASVEIASGVDWDQPPELAHRCSEDHVEAWPNWTKEVQDADRCRTVRLSFARCTASPATTLVMHLELDGPVYKHMSERRNVALPSFGHLAHRGSIPGGSETSATPSNGTTAVLQCEPASEDSGQSNKLST